MTHPSAAVTVRVLESYRGPRPTTNPYIVQLTRALENEPGCQLLTFTFKRGIFGSYDVFHVHWPEVIFKGSGRFKGLVRELLFSLVLVRIQLSGTPIVRTRHNLEPHSPLTRRQQHLNDWVERLTTATIRLNDSTACPAGTQVATIPHGDYKEWFAGCARQCIVPGRISYFGLIREYKGVESLLAAFLKTTIPGLTLAISGNPSSTALGELLRSQAKGSAHIGLDFRYLSDEELVGAVTASELIVLPYEFMHNSGAALAALSLNRPVLVPDVPVNRRLAAEVGTGWVHFFTGTLDASDLEAAVLHHRSCPPVADPDLSARSWQTTGKDHLRVFENVLLRQHAKSDAVAPHHTAPSDVG